MLIDPYLIMSEQWMPWKQRVYSLIKKNEIHSITGITSLYHGWSISTFLISLERLNAGKPLYQHSILDAGENIYNARWIQLIQNGCVKNNCCYDMTCTLKYLSNFFLLKSYFVLFYSNMFRNIRCTKLLRIKNKQTKILGKKIKKKASSGNWRSSVFHEICHSFSGRLGG